MGAGAAQRTTISECAQAYISAVLDAYDKELPRKTANGKYEDYKFEDLKKILGDKIFQKAKNKVNGKLGGVTIPSIEKFLMENNDWFLSSVNISNKVYIKLGDMGSIGRALRSKISQSGDYLYYVRGDSDIFPMIRDIFSSIKKTIKGEIGEEIPYKDINKWCPADIYYASSKASISLKEFKSNLTKTSLNRISFTPFNDLFFNLIKSGDLLPLSLKKSPSYTQTAVKTIRIVKGDVEKTLAGTGYRGYVFCGGNKIFDGKNIYIKVGKSWSLQFRDKGSESGGTHVYNGIITGGSEALDGTIGGGTIGMVISGIDSGFGGNFTQSKQKEVIDKCKILALKLLRNKNNLSGIENDIILKSVYGYCIKYGNPIKKGKEIIFSSKSNKSSYSNFSVKNMKEFYENIKKYAYDNKGVAYSTRALTQWLFTKYFGGKIIEKMESNKRNANKIVKHLLMFIGSRHKDAAPHFKASDSSAF
jgi:hypothetical protein